MNDTIKSESSSVELERGPTSSIPEAESEDPVRFNWRTNVILFVLTVVSVFLVGGWTFAVPLMAILVAHEFGHYIAARLHRVPASLPYFLPLPLLNPFGTLGAIIVMPRRIRSRSALLDIGAAGPLAGMVIAIPLMFYGLSLSELRPAGQSIPYTQEGQSILYWAVKYAVFGPIPAGYDVELHPTAFAAWAGFFVTFLNMLPFSQLDGGHVSYALLGSRQNRLAHWLLLVPPVLVIYNFWIYVRPIIDRGLSEGFSSLGWSSWAPAGAVTLWIFLGILLLVLKRVAGADHPPVDDERLSPARRMVGAITMFLFVLLFMPSPLVSFLE